MKFEIKVKVLGGGVDTLVLEDYQKTQLHVMWRQERDKATLQLGLIEKEDLKRLAKAI